MDKKIDLDKQNNSTPIKINVNPNSRNTITLNLSTSRKRPNLNGGNNQTFIQKQRHVNYHSYASEPENYDELNEEEIENEEIEEAENEEDSDEELDFDKDDIDRLKEEYEKRKQEKAKKELKDKNSNSNGDASNSSGNTTNTTHQGTTGQTAGSPAGTSGGGTTTGGTAGGTAAGGSASGGTAAGGAAAGGSAAGGAAAGGAAAGGSAAGGAAAGGAGAGGVVGGAYVALWAIIIIIIIVVVLFLLSVVIAAIINAENQYMYGRTCPSIVVENTDCDSNGNNCSNKYNETVSNEDYIAGVIAARTKDINTNNIEYFKTLAVLVRTYTINNLTEECKVNGNITFQEYMTVSDSPNSEIIIKAVQETVTEVILKNDVLLNIKNSNLGLTKEKEQALINNGKKYEENIKEIHGEKVEITKNIMILSGANGFVNPTRIISCSSPYGDRESPFDSTKKEKHTGLDISIAEGEPIFAAKDGKITAVVKNVTTTGNCDDGFGNYVQISHGDGSVTIYAHMKYGSIPSSIIDGYEVLQGQQIGQVGSTGCSTGNHLHYEIRIDGNDVDPSDYIDLTNASGTCKR